jgi:hypothetical protein
VPRAAGPEIVRFVITCVLLGGEDGWKIIVAAPGAGQFGLNGTVHGDCSCGRLAGRHRTDYRF